MKTSCRRLSLLTALALGGLAPTVFAAGDSGPKTHTLFMGVELSVEYEGKPYPVQDVMGDNFVIVVNGRKVEVRARYGPLKIKIDRALKIAGTAATVEELKTDRVYTSGNDPQRRMIEAQSQVVASQQAASQAAAVYAGSQIQAHAVKASMQHGDAGMPPLGPTPDAAERSLNAAGASLEASYSQATSLESESRRQESEENYDAIEVSFKIASDQPVKHPYVVALVEFHAPAAKPGTMQSWVYAKSMDPLEAKARRVTIREGGFPFGYHIDSFQLHVFDQGREIASNVSDNQVRLTREETFAYLLLNYLGSHKGETAKATPAMGRPSPETFGQLPPADASRTYFVKVSAGGEPEGSFADASLRTAVPGPVAPVLETVRFYPALDNGRPIEGVAEVSLNSLVY